MARIGIVGTGFGVRVQLPTFREAGLDVTAIAGFHANKTREIAREVDVRAFDDWRDLVRSPDIDLVSITTPPSEHREMAIAALKAGKHVLLEKPTALNVAEAEELVAAAKAHPRQIALIDHELRFLPSFLEVRKRIGELGAIRFVEIRYTSPSRGSRSREWTWWSDKNRGGGTWGAVGSHFIDALRYFGMEFESVLALLPTIIDRRPFGDSTREVTAEDIALVHCRMRGGAVVTMNLSFVASGPDEPSTMTIHGEDGAMRFIAVAEVLRAKRGEAFTPMAGVVIEKRPGNSPGGNFGTATLYLGQALRAALDDGDRDALTPGATFADGLEQQRVLDAGRRSASSGCWVAL